MGNKFVFFLILLFSLTIHGQEVYQHISYLDIYEFLDELSSEQIITINSAIKPFSRNQITQLLTVADENKDKLNSRQQGELIFYLKDYNKELKPDKNFNKRKDAFFYKDSLFTFSINPVIGFESFLNKGKLAYSRWVGGEIFGYAGNHFGFYTNLRDYHESQKLASKEYKTIRQGGNYNHGNEYSEMRGGITYSWKWGSLGLIKDHLTWGTNYHGSNIFSNRAPSFPFINLKMKPAKWIELNYIHGWLVSEVIDSIQTYKYGYGTRQVMMPKFLAANILTVTPHKKINISVGNSIIYSDIGVHPAYLIPLFFYKAADHSTTGTVGQYNYKGQNAQMYMDLSYRAFKKTHFYASIFIDEIGTDRMFNKKNQSNFFSLKSGAKFSNIIYNTSFTFEFTRTNPFTYRHFIPTTTFESNLYNLGHYLGDNAQEFYFGLSNKPIKNLSINLAFTYAQVGNYIIYTGIGTNGWGLPFMENIDWSSNNLSLEARYQLINDMIIRLGFHSNQVYGPKKNEYTPSIMQGNYFTVGVNIGF